MNAGITADTVYEDLKALVLSGTIRPGSRLAPHRLATRLFAGVTPIREALLRLTGERLVEMKVNDGFHLPGVTESSLRDLYAWNEDVVRLSMHLAGKRGSGELSISDDTEDVAKVFQALAAASGSQELEAQIAACNDRLASLRTAETEVFEDWRSEAIELGRELRVISRESARTMHVYHTRRIKNSAKIMIELLNTPDL
ncbi:regulatory GntR family protein [Novosphingobium sp. PhB55]|uniref:GntR family transcriptional regulator n=1 Tax=Novosphingobium sp. PhB55 TaxID=2485106 RepID=UPI0010D7E9A5|nr:GntR family transcriptional regulator [Novosphingobium sp. PhB55]TDW61560.1 regulatory GntR family protein [Novosphingobium sp. PhB55]